METADTPTVGKLSANTDVTDTTDTGFRGRPRPRELLTDAIVRKLPTPARGAKITYDGGDPSKRVTGFGVRVTAAGARAFILNYSIDGLERRYTIGPFPQEWKTAEARKEAQKLKRRIADGHDPLLAQQEKREAPTMRDLIERWRSERAPKKRERSRREDESLIRQWIDPELGNRKVAAIRASDVDRLHAKITAHGTPVRANRTIALVKRLLNLAKRWEMRGDNPAEGTEFNHEEPVERYLTEDELGRLSAALAADRNQTAADVIRLLVLTGARRGETLAAPWAQFDLEKEVWVKPSSHTKQNKKHHVPLSPAAMQLLLGMKEDAERRAQQQRRRPSPYLFPADRREGAMADLKSTWRRICKAAKVDGVRVHDLRHTYASLLANSGASLEMIGGLLGHTQWKTTKRYIHLFDNPLRVVAGQAGALVTAAANQQKGEVIPLPQRKV